MPIWLPDERRMVVLQYPGMQDQVLRVFVQCRLLSLLHRHEHDVWQSSSMPMLSTSAPLARDRGEVHGIDGFDGP